jgi:hypothetical protein
MKASATNDGDLLLDLCSLNGLDIIHNLKQRDQVPEWDDPQVRLSDPALSARRRHPATVAVQRLTRTIPIVFAIGVSTPRRQRHRRAARPPRWERQAEATPGLPSSLRGKDRTLGPCYILPQ